MAESDPISQSLRPRGRLEIDRHALDLLAAEMCAYIVAYCTRDVGKVVGLYNGSGRGSQCERDTIVKRRCAKTCYVSAARTDPQRLSASATHTRRTVASAAAGTPSTIYRNPHPFASFNREILTAPLAKSY
jgi:hypothetical protein